MPWPRRSGSTACASPLVVDEAGVIIVGHTRYKAAMKLGLTEVPVHVAAGLTPAQARAYRIADNQTATMSIVGMRTSWPLELIELQKLDFDLNLTGFSADELLRLIEPPSGDRPDRPRRDPRTARRGDHQARRPVEARLAPLAVRRQRETRRRGSPARRSQDSSGQHRPAVQRQSRAAIEQRDRRAGSSSFARLRQLRPPEVRNVEPHPGESPADARKKLRAKDRPLANDFVSDEEFDRLLRAWFGNIARVLVPGRAFYIWGGYSNLGNYPPALKECGLYFSPGDCLGQAASGAHAQGFPWVL